MEKITLNGLMRQKGMTIDQLARKLGVPVILERYQVKLSMPKGVHKIISEKDIKSVRPTEYFNNEVYGFRFVEKSGAVFELHLGICYK